MSAKAWVFYGKGDVRYEALDLPEVGEDEILCEMLAATICGSDLSSFAGKRNEAVPSILGHEGVGRVISSRRNGIVEGDRITFAIITPCRYCENCDRGFPQKCSKLFKFGHERLCSTNQLNGCYATHVLMRANTHVVKLGDDVADNIVAPANCAMSTVVNALQYIPAGEQHTEILVQGAGMLGLYACAYLNERGCNVYCTDISDDRLHMARQYFGASLTSQPPDGSIDAVLEVCGDPASFDSAMRALRPGGIYILVGMVHPDSKLDVTGEQIIRKCLTIVGIHNYRPEHLDEAVNFLRTTQHKTADELLNIKDEMRIWNDMIQ